MFSKALFKQSCKANGTMWAVITFAVCFMLACVMLISGSDSIGSTVTAVEDAIVRKEIDASLESRALGYYERQTSGLQRFDALFLEELPAAMQSSSDPNVIGATAFAAAADRLKAETMQQALADNPDADAESSAVQEAVAVVLYALKPDDPAFDYLHENGGQTPPAPYDVSPILQAAASGNAATFIQSKAHLDAICDRAEQCATVFLAGNITSPAVVEKLVAELSTFGVTPEKYAGFGYDYNGVKTLAADALVSYRYRLERALEPLNTALGDGTISSDEYTAQVEAAKRALTGDIAESLLASLPTEVAAALLEVGQIDLYSLVVGSIFYKLAGLLLPIIFVIMASNNLIAGQVDSGSMAYVLSTSTKRQTVVFTQAVFLLCSLLSMFTLTTLTGFVCLAIVGSKVSLGYGELAFLNLGAFLVLFAISGLCFATSCYFDRSKRSMAVGGGLSIFALVAAMLGLFGSPVIPSVVRLDALNNFNYVTVISLFDAISILHGTTTFLWKFAILLVLGALGYAFGAWKFVKKDLPL